jgi:hypothetical protein
LKEDDVIDCLRTLGYIETKNKVDDGKIAEMNAKSAQNF